MKKILLFLILNVTFSKAQFTPLNGPNGCDGGALFCSNDSALAEVNGNCFRTLDGGQSWQDLTSNGLVNMVNPDCFARLGNTIYMGCNSGNRMYRTTNFGNSWTTYNDSFPFIGANCSAVPKIMVRSGNKVFVGGTNFGLRYTTAANDGWHIVTIPGATGNIIEGLSVVGQDSLWVNVGSGGNNKLFFSSNNGVTWTQATHPVLAGVSVTDVIKVGNKILAGTSQGGFNSVFESTNYGTTWTTINPSIPIVKQLVKVSNANIYGIGFDGLYQSINQGSTWTKIHGQNPQRIGIWGNNNSKLLLSFILNGLHTTSMSSFSLSHISPAASKVFGLEQVGGKIVVVHQGGMAIRDTGVVGSWQVVNNLKNYYTTYVNSMRKYNNVLYVCTDRGVFYTSNLGVSFDSIPALSGNNVQYYYKSATVEIVTLFGISGIWGGIKRSINGGSTWTNSSAGGGTFGAAITNDIVNYNGQLFLGTNAVYARSSDNGATWTLPGFFFQNGAKFVIHNDSLFRMDYLNDIGKALWRSSGNVTSWRDINSNFPSTIPGNSFWVEPAGLFASNNKLLVYNYSTQQGIEGLYEYSIATNSWTSVSNTGGYKAYTPFLLSINGSYYAGTSGKSVWKTGPSAVGIKEINEFSSKNSLIVYPNPANDLININSSSFVKDSKLYIMDVSGKLAFEKSLTQENESFNVSHLAPGMYLIKLVTKTGSSATKFIKE
jgi:photosystem II stability/assembly factor-like uncharacterized protein